MSVDTLNAAHGSELLSKFFRAVLAPGTSIDMAINGAVTPVEFRLGPVAGSDTTWELDDLNFVIVDNGITPTEFGGLGVALANGIKLEFINEAGVVHDFTDGHNILKNDDFGFMSGFDNIITAAAGDDEFRVHWDLHETFGHRLLLNGATGEHLLITIQDDLTGITEMEVMAHGLQDIH